MKYKHVVIYRKTKVYLFLRGAEEARCKRIRTPTENHFIKSHKTTSEFWWIESEAGLDHKWKNNTVV